MNTATRIGTAATSNRRRLQRHGPDVGRVDRSLRDLKKGISTSLDPLGMAAPILHAPVAWMLHPQELAKPMAVIDSDLVQLHWHTLHRMRGRDHEEPIQPNPDDSRFTDPVWSESPRWDLVQDLVKDGYLTFTHRAQDMLYDTPALSTQERRRAAFWWRKWLNAVAPTNFLLSNPVALRKAVETEGQSLLDGWRNFADDFHAGNVRIITPPVYAVGPQDDHPSLADAPGTYVLEA